MEPQIPDETYQLALFGEPTKIIDLSAQRKKRQGAKASPDAPVVFSFGGGVQSMAALVLAAQGKINCKTFLFANVGEDSENPATIRYFHEVAKPYAAAHGIDLIEVRKTRKDGTPDSVWARLTRPGSRSIGIPVRMSNGAPGNRTCTVDFKIKPVAKWLKQHGASKKKPGKVLLGISLDEFQRMRNDSGIAHVALGYPLIDLRLTRQDCIQIILAAGLSLPEKSSCWFCPFQTLKRWQWRRHNRPVEFWKSSRLETFINQKRAMLGLDEVWLSGALKPLDKATSEEQQMEWAEEEEGQYSCGAFTCAVS